MNPAGEPRRLRSKTVRGSDNTKLALPVALTDLVWPPGVERSGTRKFQVVDIYGQSWIFNGKLRFDKKYGYRKPELSGPGWKAFLQAMDAKVGDKLVFYSPPPNGAGPAAPPPDAPPLVFVLSVKRRITIGGETFSGHVCPMNST